MITGPPYEGRGRHTLGYLAAHCDRRRMLTGRALYGMVEFRRVLRHRHVLHPVRGRGMSANEPHGLRSLGQRLNVTHNGPLLQWGPSVCGRGSPGGENRTGAYVNPSQVSGRSRGGPRSRGPRRQCRSYHTLLETNLGSDVIEAKSGLHPACRAGDHIGLAIRGYISPRTRSVIGGGTNDRNSRSCRSSSHSRGGAFYLIGFGLQSGDIA